MKRLTIVLALLAALCAPAGLCAQGWTNPMVLPGLGSRSLGDPYIMKYRGYYYLYVSADDRNIYCWRTKDLMEWSEAVVCCTDPTTAVAYAPEVIYWNGLFYMCTSPRGGGHYLLTSESPLGPFEHKTGNMGRDIDGSMFVDDNGKWYFYHANNQGIRGCTMPTHLSFGDDVDLGCCMSGQWTEGPCVFKRNGLYYLLYTGNHVWTNGYRIDYAISSNGPLSGFRPQSEQNPILVDTETPTHKALGHGTAFVGPDLDTYFFCYHNLQDNKSRRLLNFERIAWNGDKLMMTGPTDWEQDRPLVATNDYFERTELTDDWRVDDGGSWSIVDKDHLNQQRADGMHTALFTPCAYGECTAEFTLRAAEGTEGLFGAVFAYRDGENFSEAMIDGAERKLVVNIVADGALKTSKSYTLPDDFNPACWHAIRVEQGSKRLRVYIDGMRKCQLNMQPVEGCCGYRTQGCAADFGYIAVSPSVDGSGMLGVSLPVPGMVAANLCAELSDEAKATNYSMGTGASSYMKCEAGARLTYNLNVQRDNRYNIGLRYRCATAAVVRLLCDGTVVADRVELPPSRSSVVVQTLKDVTLPGGRHTLTVEVVEGSPWIYEYLFKRGVMHPHVMADNFDGGFGEEWGYREGNWTTTADGRLESTGRYGKMLMGGFDDIHLTDYTVECDVYYPTGAMNGGLLVRTTNASTGGADDNPVLGTDFLQGYYFLASTSSVALGKHNFGWQSLASAPKAIDPGVPHHMKVEVEGATIRCYLDDMESPLITYTDSKPFITGRAGLRVHDTNMQFDNFIVTPKQNDDTALPHARTADDVHDTSAPLRYYNLQGQQLPPADALPHGLYIVETAGRTQKLIL